MGAVCFERKTFSFVYFILFFLRIYFSATPVSSLCGKCCIASPCSFLIGVRPIRRDWMNPTLRSWMTAEERNQLERQAIETCRQEQTELALYLLEIGADVNEVTVNDGGISAISLATSYGNIPMMKMLLDFGADTEIADYEGRTPVFRAKNNSTLSLLMDNGANIDAKDGDGKTALRVAMCKKEFEWGFKLLEHGASFKIANDAKC